MEAKDRYIVPLVFCPSVLNTLRRRSLAPSSACSCFAFVAPLALPQEMRRLIDGPASFDGVFKGFSAFLAQVSATCVEWATRDGSRSLARTRRVGHVIATLATTLGGAYGSRFVVT